MRTTLLLTALMLTASLALPLTAVADRHVDCKSRETTCDDVDVGDMSCMPYAGEASLVNAVVGSRDTGTFRLLATGTNAIDSWTRCEFAIRVDASQVTFNEGFAPGILAPYGGITHVSSQSCPTLPGESCQAVTTFGWWRAVHGVTFDVPYQLLANGQVVAEGRVHYYDPVGYEDVMGGATVVTL